MPSNETMMSVFISKSGDDNDAVKRIVSSLEKENINVWVDFDDIDGGEDYRVEIVQNGILKADVVVFIMSRSSVQSADCDTEIQIAKKHNKQILVFRIDDTVFDERVGGKYYHLMNSQLISTDMINNYDQGILALLRCFNKINLNTVNKLYNYIQNGVDEQDILSNVEKMHEILFNNPICVNDEILLGILEKLGHFEEIINSPAKYAAFIKTKYLLVKTPEDARELLVILEQYPEFGQTYEMVFLYGRLKYASGDEFDAVRYWIDVAGRFEDYQKDLLFEAIKSCEEFYPVYKMALEVLDQSTTASVRTLVYKKLLDLGNALLEKQRSVENVQCVSDAFSMLVRDRHLVNIEASVIVHTALTVAVNYQSIFADLSEMARCYALGNLAICIDCLSEADFERYGECILVLVNYIVNLPESESIFAACENACYLLSKYYDKLDKERAGQLLQNCITYLTESSYEYDVDVVLYAKRILIVSETMDIARGTAYAIEIMDYLSCYEENDVNEDQCI